MSENLVCLFVYHQCQIVVGFKPSLNLFCWGLNIQLVWFTGKIVSDKSLSRLEGYFWAPTELLSRFNLNSFLLYRPKPAMIDKAYA